MDILDISLDILLKPPQPFIGLFFLMVLDWFTKYDTEWFKYTHMPTFIWNSIK